MKKHIAVLKALSKTGEPSMEIRTIFDSYREAFADTLLIASKRDPELHYWNHDHARTPEQWYTSRGLYLVTNGSAPQPFLTDGMTSAGNAHGSIEILEADVVNLEDLTVGDFTEIDGRMIHTPASAIALHWGEKHYAILSDESIEITSNQQLTITNIFVYKTNDLKTPIEWICNKK